MKICFRCRDERCPALIEYRPSGTGEEQFGCPRCGRGYTVHNTDTLFRGEMLRKCAMCAGQEMFIRKNFPQKTGLLVVVAAALISVLFLKANIMLAYGVLAAAVLVDIFAFANSSSDEFGLPSLTELLP